MRYCSKCQVEVIGQLTFCPLCQSELQLQGEEVQDIFPNLKEQQKSSHMFLKILGFVSVVISMVAIFFNVVLDSDSWWSLIVILTSGCVWVSLAMAIKKHRNLLKYLLYQSVILILFAIFLDYITGNIGWALTYVVPIVLTVAMIVMYLLSKILHLEVGDYMIYLLLDALFGIIPIVFLLTNQLQTDMPSFICILASMISVSGLTIFEGNNMLSELKRRLHV